MATKKTEKAKKFYLVTTAHRGVFAGWAYPDETSGLTVKLYNCRNCVYWSADIGGFVGLATKGPSASCKIGPAAPELELRAVTSVALCTEDATRAWESASWR